MSDWTAGYVADIGYTYGYYLELNPQRAKLAFMNAGLVCPSFGTACELGFGQGLSANIHAAGSGNHWSGTDFNPSQASFAQELAKASGTQANLYDQSFAEYTNRSDLPDFDFIGLHGIWSWISDENRAVIVDFVRRKLKLGGVLYVSYNTMPGWSVFAPMRHLMTEHARIMGSEGQGIVGRIDGALAFSDKLLAANPMFASANPQLPSRMDKVKSMSRHYLAREYFNQDWHPMYFNDMTSWFSEAKLTYACSAQLLDHVDVLNLTTDQQALLNDIQDLQFRELVRDFMRNQQFRRDYWVKGARPLNRQDRDRAMSGSSFILVVPRDAVTMKITAGLGEVNLKEDLYNAMLDVMADYKPHSFAALEKATARQGLNATQLREMLLILCGSGYIALVQDDASISKGRKTSARLNAQLVQKATINEEILYLASPVTGGGVNVSRFHQLFLLARLEGLKTSDEWAGFAWQKLRAQGQLIVKNGAALQTPDENQAELRTAAAVFEKKTLPLLTNLGIA